MSAVASKKASPPQGIPAICYVLPPKSPFSLTEKFLSINSNQPEMHPYASFIRLNETYRFIRIERKGLAASISETVFDLIAKGKSFQLVETLNDPQATVFGKKGSGLEDLGESNCTLLRRSNIL